MFFVPQSTLAVDVYIYVSNTKQYIIRNFACTVYYNTSHTLRECICAETTSHRVMSKDEITKWPICIHRTVSICYRFFFASFHHRSTAAAAATAMAHNDVKIFCFSSVTPRARARARVTKMPSIRGRSYEFNQNTCTMHIAQCQKWNKRTNKQGRRGSPRRVSWKGTDKSV